MRIRRKANVEVSCTKATYKSIMLLLSLRIIRQHFYVITPPPLKRSKKLFYAAPPYLSIIAINRCLSHIDLIMVFIIPPPPLQTSTCQRKFSMMVLFDPKVYKWMQFGQSFVLIIFRGGYSL